MRKKIAFVTGSRADYGLIYSIIKKSQDDPRFDTHLIRIGHSLSSESDFEDLSSTNITIHSIRTSFGIENLNNKLETVKAFGEIVSKAGDIVNEIKPDLVFLPGDRFEIFSAGISAFYQEIPLAQLFAGDKSQGGHADDLTRHSITKLCKFIYPVCEDSYNRVLNMGEPKKHVFNFGSPVVDNLKETDNTRPFEGDYAIFTFHPISSLASNCYEDTNEILKALSDFDFKVVLTGPNNEEGANEILRSINEHMDKNPNFIFHNNLGWKEYLRYLKHACFSIGNSSSNMLEAPIVNTYSINVGERQMGRYAPESVYHCSNKYEDIKNMISKVYDLKDIKVEHPYGNGNVAEKILDSLFDGLNDKSMLSKLYTI